MFLNTDNLTNNKCKKHVVYHTKVYITNKVYIINNKWVNNKLI